MTKFLSLLASCIFGVAVASAQSQVDHARLLVADAQNKTFAVQSNTNLHLDGVAQFRYVYNNADTSNGTKNNSYGFSVPRVRLDLSGTVGDSDVSYRVSPYINDNGNVTLQDAWAQKNYGNLGIKVGQFRPLFNAEINRGDENSIAVERSIVSNTFGQDFTQGVEATYVLAGDWKVSAAFTDGWNRANSPVNSANNGYGATARISGNIFTGNNFTLATGGGVSWQDQFQVYTADVSTTVGNLSAFVSGNYLTPQHGNNIYSVVGEVGYTLQSWQPFVRGEYAHASGAENLEVVTAGVNKWLVGKSVKWTTDAGYAFNGIDAAYNVSNTGYTNTGKSGQYVLRSQITLFF